MSRPLDDPAPGRPAAGSASQLPLLGSGTSASGDIGCERSGDGVGRRASPAASIARRLKPGRASADTQRVIVESRPRSLRLAAAFPTRVGVRVWLGCLVVASAGIRALVAPSHTRLRPTSPTSISTARFPAHSLNFGPAGPRTRSELAHFPALLEPLLAASAVDGRLDRDRLPARPVRERPLHVVAAVPVYLLARRLGLGSRYALASAVFTLALPELGFSALLLSDPLAYPLVLGALYAGVVALQSAEPAGPALVRRARRTRNLREGRVVVLAVAFVIAAILLDGRSAARLQRLPFVLSAASRSGSPHWGRAGSSATTAPSYGSTSTAASCAGRRSTCSSSLSPAASRSFPARWSASSGAATAAARLRRARRPFALAGDGRDRPLRRKRQRPLQGAVPLRAPAAHAGPVRALPATWSTRPPGRRAPRHRDLAGSALLPLSGYVKGNKFDDSPFLWGYLELQWHLGVIEASLVVAALAAVGGGLALGTPGRGRWPGPPSRGPSPSLSPSRSAPTGSSGGDRAVLDAFVGADPSWVDAAQAGLSRRSRPTSRLHPH